MKPLIEDNLTSMTQIAAANGIHVVLASVTPAYDYPWKRGLEPAEKVVALNSWMKDYCARAACVYADDLTPMSDEKHGMKEGLSRDGIHPTPAGCVTGLPPTLDSNSNRESLRENSQYPHRSD
jgi:GDSL-like Lipase/Acylhydrolase family